MHLWTESSKAACARIYRNNTMTIYRESPEQMKADISKLLASMYSTDQAKKFSVKLLSS